MNLIAFLFNSILAMINSARTEDPDEEVVAEAGTTAEASALLKRKALPLESRLRQLYAAKNYQWDDDINIFGIRDESRIREDVWNDVIVVVIPGVKVRCWLGTCDPGVVWMSAATRKAKGWEPGVAHLCCAQYLNAYMVGLHNGQYEALVQLGGPVSIWRDLNENFENDDSFNRTGWFSINIHKGTSRTIGWSSAGCQVIKGDREFAAFMGEVKASTRYQGNRKARFTYTLFDKGETGPLFPELMGMVG